jgi:hypothetical protein
MSVRSSFGSLANLRSLLYPAIRRKPYQDDDQTQHPRISRRNGRRRPCFAVLASLGCDSPPRLRRSPRWELPALDPQPQKQARRGRPKAGRLFCWKATRQFRTEGDAQLETALNRIEAPPERERFSAAARWKCNGRISASFSLRISNRRAKDRAPKLLHVGRRSAPRTVDPGSKGRREAWKTSFGSGRARHTDETRLSGSEPLSHEATIRDRLMAGHRALNVESEVRNRVSGSEPLRHEATFRDRLMAGRHALNVEIEVRVLVPKLHTGG